MGRAQTDDAIGGGFDHHLAGPEPHRPEPRRRRTVARWTGHASPWSLGLLGWRESKQSSGARPAWFTGMAACPIAKHVRRQAADTHLVERPSRGVMGPLADNPAPPSSFLLNRLGLGELCQRR